MYCVSSKTGQIWSIQISWSHFLPNIPLQVFYFLEPMRCGMQSHLCQHEFCLACELGFLFQMLDRSNGQTCQVLYSSSLISVFPISVCMYVCMYVFLCTCLCVCIYVRCDVMWCACVCLFVCLFVCFSVCVCVGGGGILIPVRTSVDPLKTLDYISWNLMLLVLNTVKSYLTRSLPSS